MNGAVIIETRPISNLYDIIVNKHMKYLPKDFELNILHSNENKLQVKNIEAIKLNIQVQHLSSESYNNILTSKWFWESLERYEKVLVFQSDSEILREGIEEFMEVDYIGAPWKFQDNGGNGGLSLRSPEAMLKCIKKTKYAGMKVHGNEDVYFSNLLNSGQGLGKLASLQQAYKFSCESIYRLGTFGIHAIDKYLTGEQCQQIRKQYEDSFDGGR